MEIINLSESDDTNSSWRKSSRCSTTSCVEVNVPGRSFRSTAELAVEVSFPDGAYAGFIAEIKEGTFDTANLAAVYATSQEAAALALRHS